MKRILISQIEIHMKVREIIKNIFPVTKDVNVLDAAAGNGYMTKWLIENGFEVMAFDISTENWQLPGVRCNFSDFNKCIEADEEYVWLGCFH
jgi:2-polyprenyl-3-methyl-5-hydroxy-6-metoxy-1,4-benzoquinol methylase